MTKFEWKTGPLPKEKQILIKQKDRFISLLEYDEKRGVWVEPAFYREVQLTPPFVWATIPTPKEEDFEFTPKVYCPWCYSVQEPGGQTNDLRGVMECSKCGKSFGFEVKNEPKFISWRLGC